MHRPNRIACLPSLEVELVNVRRERTRAVDGRQRCNVDDVLRFCLDEEVLGALTCAIVNDNAVSHKVVMVTHFNVIDMFLTDVLQ